MSHSCHMAATYGTGAFFLLGMAGSLHCLGMCAPLSSLFLGHTGGKDAASLLGYHGGRLFAYATVGYLLHRLGVTLDLIFALPITLVLAAIPLALYATGVHLPLPPAMLKLQGRVLSHIRHRRPRVTAFVMGIFTPLLPCGLLYGVLATSLRAPSGAVAALWMLAFAAGTVPLLLGGQAGIRWLSIHIPPCYYRHATRALACIALVTLIGFYLHHRLS